MQKFVIILTIVCLIILVGCSAPNSQDQGSLIEEGQIRNTKKYCDDNTDCVISSSDPDNFGTCVNEEWNKKWNLNPESKNYAYDCLMTGEEKCGCVNNNCQRVDEGKPGC